VKTILLQQASNGYEELLDISNKQHSEYCKKHNILFYSVRGNLQTERHPSWNKILLIMEALKSFEVQQVIWIDADAVIVDFNQDIRYAITSNKELGMCKHPNPEHYNSGAIFVKNQSRSVDFFNDVWKLGDINHPWHEQIRINETILKYSDIIETVDNKWNSTLGVTEVPSPVVYAFHGQGLSKSLLKIKEFFKI
jgi:hypothetical protein